eukprot:1982411-Pyramimonas_sp.AAC.1
MQRMAILRQHPDLAAAIRATTPLGTPRQGQPTTGPGSSPMAAPTTDQPGRRQSALEQQRFTQQHKTAMSEMRLLGVDVTDRNNWTPHWEWHPDASPSADHPDRLKCVPAFAARSTYLPLLGPAPSPMDHPLERR